MNNDKYRIKGVVFFGAIISTLAAFINKYPFVYADTGSYIYSGFNGLVFDDRSIFYGLFLRHISLSSSLWYAIFAQGLLVSYAIRLTLGMFFTGIKRDYVFIFCITILALFTGFSFIAGILIPDIFSSLSLLCLTNLLLNKNLKKSSRFLLSIIFAFSICTQFSSIAIMLLLFFILGTFLLVRKVMSRPLPISVRHFFLSLSVVLGCLIIIPATHYAFSGKFRISGSTHVFVMNHLLETGVLEDYLEDECDHNKFKICEYKDKLGWDFIWSPESALQKTGGWEANRKEYNFIIRDILTTPKYVILLSQKSVEYTLKQFFTFEIVVPAPQLHSSAPYDQINWRFKGSMREYISSRQSAAAWNLTLINFIQTILVIGSFIFLMTMILIPSALDKFGAELKWMVLLVLTYSFINSFVCSNLSTIDSRFQNRIVWLMPLCSIICFFKFLEFTSLFKERLKKLTD